MSEVLSHVETVVISQASITNPETKNSCAADADTASETTRRARAHGAMLSIPREDSVEL